MKSWIGLLLILPPIVAMGCTTPPRRFDPWRTQNACYDNPALLPAADAHFTWERIVDVLDDYFEIQREIPVQTLDYVMTEGRIDTFPRLGATILEPWYRDSVTLRERVESTLQPIRRRAHVRVVPTDDGYLVEVIVYKELEVVARPDHATAGRATFIDNTSPSRIAEPIPEFPTSEGWIALGRDYLLEQRIIAQLLGRPDPYR